MTILKRLRVAQRLSQEEVGAAVGLSGTTISTTERRASCPSLQHRRALSKYFTVPVDRLFDRDGYAATGEDERPENEDGRCDTVAIADTPSDEWIRCDVAATISGRSLSAIEYLVFGSQDGKRASILPHITVQVPVSDGDGSHGLASVICVHRATLIDYSRACKNPVGDSKWQRAIKPPEQPNPQQLDIFGDPSSIAQAAKSNPAILDQLMHILSEMKRNSEEKAQ